MAVAMNMDLRLLHSLSAIAGAICVLLVTPEATAQDGGVVRQGQSVETRVYPIGDLIEATSLATSPPRAQAMGGGSGGGFSGGGGGSPQPPRGVEELRAEQVTALVRSTIDSDSWRKNGGSLGSIEYVPWTRSLIVTHTPVTLGRIEALLDELAPRTRMVTTHIVLAPIPDLAANTEVVGGLLHYTGDAATLKSAAQALVAGYDGEA